MGGSGARLPKVLIIAACVAAGGGTSGWAQEQGERVTKVVSLSEGIQPFGDVLDPILDASLMSVFVDSTIGRPDLRVPPRVDKLPWEDALERVLLANSLRASVEGGMIWIHPVPVRCPDAGLEGVGDYTGSRLNWHWRDADLRDLLPTFSQFSGLRVEIEADFGSYKSHMNPQGVPWQRVLDVLLKDACLKAVVAGETIRILPLENEAVGGLPNVTILEGDTVIDALRQVSDVAGLNVVVQQSALDVTGSTLAPPLHEVNWKTALEVVAANAGLQVELSGNVIRVIGPNDLCPTAGLLTSGPEYHGKPLSLDFCGGADVRDILRFMSDFTGKSLVLNPSDPGFSYRTVPKFTEVPWDQVLDFILWDACLEGAVDGDVIRVVPAHQLSESAEPE